MRRVNTSNPFRDYRPFVDMPERRTPLRRSAKSGDFDQRITKTPASRFTSRAVLDALSNLANRALDFMDSSSKTPAGSKDGTTGAEGKKRGKFERILNRILEVASSQWPETTKVVTDYIGKIGSKVRFFNWLRRGRSGPSGPRQHGRLISD